MKPIATIVILSIFLTAHSSNDTLLTLQIIPGHNYISELSFEKMNDIGLVKVCIINKRINKTELFRIECDSKSIDDLFAYLSSYKFIEDTLGIVQHNDSVPMIVQHKTNQKSVYYFGNYIATNENKRRFNFRSPFLRRQDKELIEMVFRIIRKFSRNNELLEYIEDIN